MQQRVVTLTHNQWQKQKEKKNDENVRIAMDEYEGTTEKDCLIGRRRRIHSRHCLFTHTHTHVDAAAHGRTQIQFSLIRLDGLRCARCNLMSFAFYLLSLHSVSPLRFSTSFRFICFPFLFLYVCMNAILWRHENEKSAFFVLFVLEWLKWKWHNFIVSLLSFNSNAFCAAKIDSIALQWAQKKNGSNLMDFT